MTTSLTGTANGDTIVGTDSGNDYIQGFNGDDSLEGNGGRSDSLYGGQGNDTLTGSATSSYLEGNEGDDVLILTAGRGNLFGNDGNDYVEGSNGNDQLEGGSGDDTLFGGGSHDYLNGGGGNNSLMGGNGNDHLEVSSDTTSDNRNWMDAGNGADTVYGGASMDTILGGAGNDSLLGGDGNDVIDGGSGDDFIRGGNGADGYVFGSNWGHDTLYDFDLRTEGSEADYLDIRSSGLETADLSFSETPDGLLINGTGDNTILIKGLGLDDVASMQIVDRTEFTGTDGDDVFYGSLLDEQFSLGGGSDTLVAGAEWGEDRILDFQIGEDLIDLRGSSYGFYDLDIVQDGDDAVISNPGGGTLILENIDIALLTIDQFLADGYADRLIGESSPWSPIPDLGERPANGTTSFILTDGEVIPAGTTAFVPGTAIALDRNIDATNDGVIWAGHASATIGGAYIVAKADLTNNGTIVAVSGTGTAVGVGLDGGDGTYSYRYTDAFLHNEGDIYAISGGSAYGVLDEGYVMTGYSVVNSGSITVWSNDWAYGISTEENSVHNTGTITVAGNEQAYGITAGLSSWSSGDQVVNDGIINVSGATASDSVGIFVRYGSSNGLIENNGTIEAGYGIRLFTGSANIVNTGTIDGSVYGFYVSSSGTTESISFTNSGTVNGRFAADAGMDSLINSGTYTGAVTMDDGNDTISNSGSLVGTVNMGNGNDTITNTGSMTGTVYMGYGNDVLTSAGGTLEGAVYGGYGHDSLVGAAGADTLYGDYDNDTLDGSAGDDWLSGGVGADTLYGGAGDDTASFAASSAAVAVSLVNGRGTGGEAEGDVYIDIENLTGSRYGDSLTGNRFANVLSGGAGDDTLVAGYGYDSLSGGDGDDYLKGGYGIDTLEGGAGADTLDGEQDNDWVSYAGSDEGVSLTLLGNGWATGSGGDAEGDRVANVQRIVGSEHNDSLGGNSGNNWIVGGNGDDLLESGVGVDTLEGGLGNDTIRGNYTADSLSGGDGADGVFGGYGNDTVDGGDGDDTLLGERDMDLIHGGNGDDLIGGGTEADTLYGDAGNDTIRASEGNDLVYGGDGDDSIEGGNGRDTITGGAGDDWLSGGGEPDTFIFADGDGNDTISDFQVGRDRLDLSDTEIDFTSLDDLVAHASTTTVDGVAGLLIETGDGDSIFLQGLNTNHLAGMDIDY